MWKVLFVRRSFGIVEGDYTGLNLSDTPRMMIILAYRGNEEKKALKEIQEEIAKDKAREQRMAEPLFVWHDALITLKV